MWEVAVSLAKKCDVTVTPLRQRHTQRPPRQLEDSYLVTTSTIYTIDMRYEEYRTGVYFTTIDVLLMKLNNRFSELNVSHISSLEH